MKTYKKKKAIQSLWQALGENQKVKTCIRKRGGKKRNVGFINQFEKHSFIPNLWFDWKRKVEASIMVIGQDWGPYKELKKLIDEYQVKSKKEDFDYDKFLLETFSSRTEDFIKDVVKDTYESHFNKELNTSIWSKFIFTVAVLFTRRGEHFRGNEYYDENFGLEESQSYLQKQINIVDPKVIVALGGAAWKNIRDIYGLKKYPKQISKVIDLTKGQVIKLGNKIVIPAFHPACHVTKEEKVGPWTNIWSWI
jgi:hypothetical protein